jgi:NADPH:quinone reductase-like Zn-dependent oxidoreductase
LFFVQPKPALGTDANAVLVRVQAAALNPVDYKLPMMVVNNKVIGFDVAGVVEASNSPDFQVGDEVYGNCANGSQAEFALCDATKIAKKVRLLFLVTCWYISFQIDLSQPAELSFIQAAAIGVAYLTAFEGLQARGNITGPGQHVLILGASGGCGAAGVQICKALGCQEIVGVCSGANEEMVRELGATSTVDYKHYAADLSDAPLAAAHFDSVFDTVTEQGGSDYTSTALKCCKPDAKLVAINGTAWTWTKSMLGLQSLFDSQHQLFLVKHSRAQYEKLCNLMLQPQNGFRPLIDSQHPFSEDGMKSAYERLQSKRARGKIVIDMTKRE